MIDERNINEYIRNNLDYLGLQNADLAKKLGVKPSIITNWKDDLSKNPKIPGLKNSCILAQLFGVSIDEFYDCIYNVNIKIPNDYSYIDYENDKKRDKRYDIKRMNLNKKRSIIKSFIDNISKYENMEEKCNEIEECFEIFYVDLSDLFSLYLRKISKEHLNRYLSSLFRIHIKDQKEINIDMLYEFVKNKAIYVNESKTIDLYSKICIKIKNGEKKYNLSQIKVDENTHFIDLSDTISWLNEEDTKE